MNGRIESPSGALPAGERELHDLGQLGPRGDPLLAIQPGQLRVGAEAREEPLQATDLLLRRLERIRGLGVGIALDEQLHLGPHRAKPAAADHDDPLLVTGAGPPTLTTGGAAAGAAAEGDPDEAAGAEYPPAEPEGAEYAGADPLAPGRA